MATFRMDRRQALGAALAGGLSALGTPIGAADDAGIIDAHTHVWTLDVKRYPIKPGASVEELKPPSFTPDEFFTHARPAGVRRVVLIQMSFYGYDNSYMLDAMAAQPGVFSGVAVIEEHGKPAQTMRGLKAKGVRGFRLYPGTKLDSPGLAEMYSVGAAENLAMCHLANPEDLPGIDAMCAKHPDTPVVIDHFGRIGVDGTIREKDLGNLCRLARHPKTFVKVSAFYALGKKRPPYMDLIPMIRRLVDVFGPDRLMWASDCPYQVQNGHTYADSIALIRDRLDFLSASDRDWILHKTAEKVFFS